MNQSFITAGCPHSSWLRAMEGHILKVSDVIFFTPPPMPGQSGSGIFVHIKEEGETNTKLAAIITWHIKYHYLKKDGYPNSIGGAIPMKNLHSAIENKDKDKDKEK